ncbi:MAG: putative cation/proton antiporter YbaL [Pseudomonas citronellolis]|nr:MAG: putative cation/proton antiporter YbaL [Pseudomonas citronellolis]
MHHTPLLTTLAAGFVLAFILGTLANRLRISPLVGYLLAGVLAGPFTPGYVAAEALWQWIAAIGAILLMICVDLLLFINDPLS